MEDRLSELKEKQAEIGDKISLLQQTNKKKDEEAAEIRQLIAECRENLNRIKGLNPSAENVSVKPTNRAYQNADKDSVRPTRRDFRDQSAENSLGRPMSRGNENAENDSDRPISTGNADDTISEKSAGKRGTKDQGSKKSIQAGSASGSKGDGGKGAGEPRSSRGKSEAGDEAPDKESYSDPESSDTRRNAKMYPLDHKGKTAEPSKGERVSCKVDLNKMKVRIRGPSEDLKKLDATQLINLLEKFQCQELVINTGEEVQQDPEEIRLLYRTHPGNLVMLAGLIMIAFLFNANLRSVRDPFLPNLMFLSSFAIHYGMVFWMTFIRSELWEFPSGKLDSHDNFIKAGCTLKFGLNYDTYHLVDNIILPKYYSLCVLLSALSLYSFLATHPKPQGPGPSTSWPVVDLVQMVLLVTTFLMELITISYFIPALIKLRNATDDYVTEEEEPETPVPPSYHKNLSKLGKLNWTMLLVNLLTLVFLGANIYYVTNKIIRK